MFFIVLCQNCLCYLSFWAFILYCVFFMYVDKCVFECQKVFRLCTLCMWLIEWDHGRWTIILTLGHTTCTKPSTNTIRIFNNIVYTDVASFDKYKCFNRIKVWLDRLPCTSMKALLYCGSQRKPLKICWTVELKSAVKKIHTCAFE